MIATITATQKTESIPSLFQLLAEDGEVLISTLDPHCTSIVNKAIKKHGIKTITYTQNIWFKSFLDKLKCETKLVSKLK